MPEIMVNYNACVNCGKCKEVCEHPTHCVLCKKCVELCPRNARHVSGEIMTSDHLIKIINKTAGYYRKYGGGITFSGGEPLLQAEFLYEVLEGIQDVHRAIETSGYATADIFDMILPSVDYVIMDLKIFDDELHKKQTGCSNKKILRNAQRLMESGKAYRIRIPLIPGVSDTEKNIREIAKFIYDIAPKTYVELLPYNIAAGAKYSQIGMRYNPSFDVDQKVKIHMNIFKEYGMECSVL